MTETWYQVEYGDGTTVEPLTFDEAQEIFDAQWSTGTKVTLRRWCTIPYIPPGAQQ